MAKKTERRVNKAMIIPGDLDDRGFTDPVPSDVQDTEAARIDATREANVGMAQVDLNSPEAVQGRLEAQAEANVGAQTETDQGLIESAKLAAWEAAQAADLETHAEKVEDLRNAFAAHDFSEAAQSVDVETHAEKVEDLRNAFEAHDIQDAPAQGPDDITPSNYP